MTSKTYLLAWACWLALPCLTAGAEHSAPDHWLASPVLYPFDFSAVPARSNEFSALRAEAIAGRLKIRWPAATLSSNATIIAYASADEPGHWPARDWRPFRMRPGPVCDATLPVDDLDVPLVYFVAVWDASPPGHKKDLALPTLTNSPAQPIPSRLSPMRVVHPRAAGLEAPTRLFWPFLEGFEEDLAAWRLLSPDTGAPPLSQDPEAHTGHAALLVEIPAGKRSVTVATTCVRGRHLLQHRALGLGLWLKARQGTGRARFTLSANAMSTNEVVALWPREATLTSHWQKVELPLSALPQLPRSAVDLFTIELIGQGPRQFLIDDLELSGDWSSGPD